MPSGNGREGGDFNFAFTVLPGELTGDDNSVTGADFSYFGSKFSSQTQPAPGTATYADGDLNGDGNVTGADFSVFSANFNKALQDNLMLSGDTNLDGIVNYKDLAAYLANRGLASAATTEDGDADGDGDVDLDDLDVIFELWGVEQRVD